MGKRRSKLWWWVAAVLIAAVVWRWCRSSDERIEATLHVKLAPGVQQLTSGLDEATVLDAEPLFVRPRAALVKDHDMASLRSGQPMPDSSGWRRVRMRGEDAVAAGAACHPRRDRLGADDGPHGRAKQHVGPRPNLAGAIERARASTARCDR